MWQQWANALLGLIVMAVPFMALTASSLTWTLVIVGAAVLILAVWGGAQEQQLEQRLRHGYQS